MQTLFSIMGIYLFIAVGFGAKWSFKEKIDDRTITLLSIYFLQIFLTFWGLLKRPIDTELLFAPALYLGISLLALLLMIPLAKIFFHNPKERSIATVAALIGNTGNLGIPLGIALFGEQSVPYLTLINLMNVFVVYTIGVFFYSRGEFSVRDSLINILKLPVLWAAMVAIILNLAGYHPSAAVDKTLMMGAYASMTMQLVLFGIYLYGIQLREINMRLSGWVISTKFLLIPLMTFFILQHIAMDPMVKGLLFLELLVPLAVANVNLASLYNCSPKTVTVQVFITSVLFLGIAFVLPTLLKMF
ncbi:MAG: AEC family transporter [Sulfuricurvum sp.]|uniref:AEC family transporter n=1 Tax=Sulfuricurvum sp. TaxID=2025608 RepID=UPI002604CB95|nr:AEC family transporter [Sulfuricurvum sp.]MDD2828366.1 AEC family transporter [Sulfuricurvum sp.]MDD4949371.1 AEC family transporter [Sulfuricurvum sp.]